MTATAPGWHDDPISPAHLRYWDGTRWTEHVSPRPSATPDQLGPSNPAHWIAPVGRSWQSITAGYLAFLCLVVWIVGPVGIVLGGVTLWLGIWGLQRALTGGHGRGRAIFGIIAGSISLLLGAVSTFFLFNQL